MGYVPLPFLFHWKTSRRNTASTYALCVVACGSVPLSLENARDSVQVLAAWRRDHGRLYVIFFFCMVFVQQLSRAGEADIAVLYTATSPLGWSPSTYGYYLAANYVALGLATFTLLPAVIRLFQLGDLALLAAGLAFRSISQSISQSIY